MVDGTVCVVLVPFLLLASSSHAFTPLYTTFPSPSTFCATHTCTHDIFFSSHLLLCLHDTHIHLHTTHCTHIPPPIPSTHFTLSPHHFHTFCYHPFTLLHHTHCTHFTHLPVILQHARTHTTTVFTMSYTLIPHTLSHCLYLLRFLSRHALICAFTAHVALRLFACRACVLPPHPLYQFYLPTVGLYIHYYLLRTHTTTPCGVTACLRFLSLHRFAVCGRCATSPPFYTLPERIDAELS